jgi:hypothetical protein
MKSFFAGFLFAMAGMILVRADDTTSMPLPLGAVTAMYTFIQDKLAVDSFDGVPAAAASIKSAVEGDQTHTFTPDFAHAVDQLAAATDLHSARIAFETVSSLLIATLAQDHVKTGTLYSAFCPMVKAYWLQTDGKTIHNPYMGSEMSDCGTFQKQF